MYILRKKSPKIKKHDIFAFDDYLPQFCSYNRNWLRYKGVKPNSHLPKKYIFICFNEGPLKMMKNAFYFILKALFVLKIFKFLS